MQNNIMFRDFPKVISKQINAVKMQTVFAVKSQEMLCLDIF